MEPLQRALKETGTDAWINGRRRDHGAERASLPVWEGDKINPIAFWSFEDCWTYLRKHKVGREVGQSVVRPSVSLSVSLGRSGWWVGVAAYIHTHARVAIGGADRTHECSVVARYSLTRLMIINASNQKNRCPTTPSTTWASPPSATCRARPRSPSRRQAAKTASQSPLCVSPCAHPSHPPPHNLFI